MVKLGISTGLFHDQDLIGHLPFIKEAGFEIIEICLDTMEWGSANNLGTQHANFFLKEGLEIWQQKIHSYNLRNKLREFNIHVHSLHLPVFPELDIACQDERTRVHAIWEFKKGIDVLEYLGGEIAIVHPSIQPFDLNNWDEKNRRLAKCRESLKELVEYCRLKKIRLAVENLLPHLLGGRVEDLNSLVDELQSPTVGVCFDTSHANLAQDPVEALKNLNKRIIALHLSDNHGQYDDHLTPGNGQIYWPGIMSSLQDIGYKDVLMLEVFNGQGRVENTEQLSHIREQALQVLENATNRGVDSVTYRL